jgi:hypothetical protein
MSMARPPRPVCLNWKTKMMGFRQTCIMFKLMYTFQSILHDTHLVEHIFFVCLLWVLVEVGQKWSTELPRIEEMCNMV